MESEKKQIYPLSCPICGKVTNYIYRIEADNEKTDWYRCQCGIIFQDKFPGYSAFDSKYLEKYDADMKANAEYTAKIYAPIVEDMTYGRMFLDVGYGTKHVMDFFEKRGWLTWGIDINEGIKQESGNQYKGDFTSYDFNPRLSKELVKEFIGEDKLNDRTFDFIWMHHFLECVENPLLALRKAFNLLSDTGLLFVSVPDIDFINKSGVNGFNYWRKHELYTMWNEQSIARELERIGFSVVLKRKNIYSRHLAWHDTHVLAQRNIY